MKKKQVKYLVAVLVFLMCLAFYANAVGDGLQQNLVRLHVLANSDSQDDQLLKLMVRDQIIAAFSEKFSNVNTKTEAQQLILQNIDEIKKCAKQTIIEKGYDYDVKVSLAQQHFPTKQYENITLPRGVYDALKVEIGEGKGQNWFCVMFPPLCFVQGVNGEADEQSLDKLKAGLTKEEYDLITSNELPVNIKFKVVELLGDSFDNVKNVFAWK